MKQKEQIKEYQGFRCNRCKISQRFTLEEDGTMWCNTCGHTGTKSSIVEHFYSDGTVEAHYGG